MNHLEQISLRLDRLEAEGQIRQLVSRYALDTDDRNIDGLAELFTEDAIFMSGDRVMMARGREAIIKQFSDRYSVLGPAMHFMHDLDIRFESPTEGRGRVSGHAELWRNGQMMVTALRYHDRYRKTASGWKFAEREILYLYYVPINEYPGILGQADRNRAYAIPKVADIPEALASWQAYTASVAGQGG